MNYIQQTTIPFFKLIKRLQQLSTHVIEFSHTLYYYTIVSYSEEDVSILIRDPYDFNILLYEFSYFTNKHVEINNEKRVVILIDDYGIKRECSFLSAITF